MSTEMFDHFVRMLERFGIAGRIAPAPVGIYYTLSVFLLSLIVTICGVKTVRARQRQKLRLMMDVLMPLLITAFATAFVLCAVGYFIGYSSGFKQHVWNEDRSSLRRRMSSLMQHRLSGLLEAWLGVVAFLFGRSRRAWGAPSGGFRPTNIPVHQQGRGERLERLQT